MLTIAYCRVSTEEQATEGFSIEGQSDRLRQYAELHELGPVVVITDPGRSGKDMNRPGLMRVMEMVGEGHVSNVVVWRLDRLSRNLSDLIGLADSFGQANVSLHSFTEKLDLSSATGRMFYNILGSFAQFYREQLGENVRMGMRQAARQGRWTNHPPTGYDLHDGLLVPNADADTVRKIYGLRAEGLSQSETAARTGITQSTVLAILRNPAYLGKIKYGDDWIQGIHEPLITERDHQAAHRGRTSGQRRGKDLMSSRVRCGQCGRSMSVMDNGAGWLGYRCWHRGKGCDVPRFSNKGLLRAALLGLRLLRDDLDLQAAIRASVKRRAGVQQDDDRRNVDRTRKIEKLESRISKLLEAYYDENISAETFRKEEQHLNDQLAALRTTVAQTNPAEPSPSTAAEQFEQVLTLLQNLDWDMIWEAATDTERRTLLDEFVSRIDVYPDHLEVEVRGAPKLNVALHEVGLRETVEITRVGGPSHRFWYRPLEAGRPMTTEDRRKSFQLPTVWGCGRAACEARQNNCYGRLGRLPINGSCHLRHLPRSLVWRFLRF